MMLISSEKDFVAIVDLPEGSHQYKFLVDGEWKLNQGEAACDNGMGTQNNVITINQADFDEFENALLRDPNNKDEKKGSQMAAGKNSSGKSCFVCEKSICWSDEGCEGCQV